MKKRLISIMTLVLLTGVLTTGCGNKTTGQTSDIASTSATADYYKNTDLKNLETFTSVTGVELNVSQDDSSGTSYNYLMDNDAKGVGAETKYIKYLEDYGFTENDDLNSIFGSTGTTVYTMDGYVIVVLEDQPQDNVLQFAINIPYSKATETNGGETTADTTALSQSADLDSLYNQIVELTKKEDFQGAYDLWWNSELSSDFDGYKDSKEYMFLSQAMLYNQNGGYGIALDMLTNDCQDLSSITSPYIDDIKKEIGINDGTYTNTNNGITYYICVLDGMVYMDSELEGTATKSSAYYTDSIVAVDSTTGEKGIGIGTMAGYDSEPEVDYAFSAIKSDSFFCGAFQGGNGDTSFGGVYNKISSSAPERNQ